MEERDFVDALKKSIARDFPQSVMYRPVDKMTLGVPDLFVWIQRVVDTWSIAIEAKQVRPLMADPMHRGRRTGAMLEHPFSGPQISMLRNLKAVGVEAFGLVRVSEDIAFRIEPERIPAKSGNFTHEEMLEIGTVVRRRPDGVWHFWSS